MTCSGLVMLDVDAEMAGHLAVACRLYRERARRDGIGVPAGLAGVERMLAARASRGQRGTPLAELWSVVQHRDMEPELVAYRDAARLLGCSERTIKRRVAAGDLPVVRVGAMPRIRVSDLHHYIERRDNR
ncbi:MAG: helix-turn-helix domain-containing protein [Nocardioidaceae bacterium]